MDFRFDPDLGRYESTVQLAGAAIAVRVASEAFDEERVAAVVEAVERERERLLDDVATDLLEDYNEGWLEDGEAEVSEEAFRARLALAAIEIGASGGGEVELVLDDDGMFRGHEVVVRLDSEYAIVRVNLEG